MSIIKLSQATVTNWSGGTTTELFIYPEGSSFANRDFELRISIATVETETSIFTPFPDTNRTLLVLKGTQLLEHQGAHKTHLKALDQDSFSGSYTTNCTGTSTNFNVMTRAPRRAKVEVLSLSKDATFQGNNSDALVFIYLLEGEVEWNSTTLHSNEGTVLKSGQKIQFKTSGQMVVVTYP